MKHPIRTPPFHNALCLAILEKKTPKKTTHLNHWIKYHLKGVCVQGYKGAWLNQPANQKTDEYNKSEVTACNSHFGQSIHAPEDIFGQRLEVVVRQTPNQQKEKKKEEYTQYSMYKS